MRYYCPRYHISGVDPRCKAVIRSGAVAHAALQLGPGSNAEAATPFVTRMDACTS
jgi:hypothetical protein